MTKGEYKVGINFNPSQDDVVGRIKRLAADFIDLVESLEELNSKKDLTDENTNVLFTQMIEKRRLKALAMTDIESAAMWAVKAATKGLPE